MIVAAIDTGQLVELVWAAAAAGVAVTIAFALFLLGVTRSADARRAQRGEPVALAYGLLALLAGAAFLGTVGFGVSVIVSK